MDANQAETERAQALPWWRQPLFHFILIGAALFAAHQWVVARGPGDEKTVIVDRAALLTFMQYRVRTFDPEQSQQMLDNLGEEELSRLIDDYIRQEVLYREAKALGLDRDDFVIRQRLIQKLEFINQDLSTQLTELSDEDLQRYFEEHRDDYTLPSRVILTHVFFDQRSGGRDRALERAESTLTTLNARSVPFNEGARHGDWFFYDVNFVGAPEEQVRRFLGKDVTDAVMTLEPSSKIWRGPYPSEYGYHLLMLTSRSPERHLELDEIRQRVEEDARRDRIRELQDSVVDKVIEAYDVRIDYVPAERPAPDQAASTR